MKTRVVGSVADTRSLEDAVTCSARKAIAQLSLIHAGPEALSTLWAMKFKQIGCDPLNSERSLNLIEQLNQTFTYLASARAVRILLNVHPELAPFTLNLGTTRGSDIESKVAPGLAAEVFAAVNPANNKKLAKDIAKVRATEATLKYVFFMCPNYAAGMQPSMAPGNDVIVWSVGGDL